MNGLLTTTALTLLFALSACGGDSGGVTSPGAIAPPVTPTAPPVTPTPPSAPAPTPAPTSPYNTSQYKQSNAATSINALAAYDHGGTGKNIIAAVLDSGISAAGAAILGANLNSQSADLLGTRGLDSGDDHGTSIALIIAAPRSAPGTHGVAFDSSVLVLRTDSSGCGTPTGCVQIESTLTTGIDRAVKSGAKIINLSVGVTNVDPRLSDAIAAATAAGVIVVAAAANAGGAQPDGIGMLANDPAYHGLLVVAGAVDATGTIASFSNRAGPVASHYVTALGLNVLTYDGRGAQAYFSGTSAATPVIVGAISLLESAFPNLTPTQVVDLLFQTATKQPGGIDAVYGQGQINLTKAFLPVGQTSIPSTSTPYTGSLSVDPQLASPAKVAAAVGQTVVLDALGRAYTATAYSAQPAAHSAIASLASRQIVAARGNATMAWNRQGFAGSSDGLHDLSRFSDSHGFAAPGPVGPYATTAVVPTGLRFTPNIGNARAVFASDSFASDIIMSPASLASPSGLVAHFDAAPSTAQRNYAVAIASNGFTVGAETSPTDTRLAVDRVISRGRFETSVGVRFSDHRPERMLDAVPNALGLGTARSTGGTIAANLQLAPSWSVALAGEADMIRVGSTGRGFAFGTASLVRTSWAASLFHTVGGLRFGLTAVQDPTNVRGQYALSLPVAYSYATRSATNRAVALDATSPAALRGEFSVAGQIGRTTFSAAGFTRAGSDGTSRRENGAAVRLSTSFD